MNPREIFKKALQDPLLKGISYIGPQNYIEITKAIKDLPESSYISEWRHTLGEVKYEYHIHINGIHKELQRLFKNNVRGGNPKLIRVYSKRKLEEIIQAAQEALHF